MFMGGVGGFLGFLLVFISFPQSSWGSRVSEFWKKIDVPLVLCKGKQGDLLEY